MRAVLQRVKNTGVSIDGTLHASIENGLCIFLGVGPEDDERTAAFLADKAARLRIFPDDQGKMNRSLLDTQGQALVISQFTLYADCSHGRRPSFIQAAPPQTADRLYQCFVHALAACGVSEVATGVFGADMQVALCNDGPVTIWLDTESLMKDQARQ